MMDDKKKFTQLFKVNRRNIYPCPFQLMFSYDNPCNDLQVKGYGSTSKFGQKDNPRSVTKTSTNGVAGLGSNK